MTVYSIVDQSYVFLSLGKEKYEGNSEKLYENLPGFSDACCEHASATHDDHFLSVGTTRHNVGGTSVESAVIGREGGIMFGHQENVQIRAKMNEGEFDLVCIISNVPEDLMRVRSISGLNHNSIGIAGEA